MGFDYDVVVIGSGFGGSDPYRRVDPVAPRSPAVPEAAPAALRLVPG